MAAYCVTKPTGPVTRPATHLGEESLPLRSHEPLGECAAVRVDVQGAALAPGPEELGLPQRPELVRRVAAERPSPAANRRTTTSGRWPRSPAAPSAATAHPDRENISWGDTPPPVTGLCSTCNCRADLNHLCWECPVYNPPRLRALATIKRGPWPSSLRTWACPEPSPPDRAIEFWRALIMFLQDPAAPPVGDRLRDSHKIQAIQAAPT
ncbi:hypothetical protein MRX96_034112 [Rhipicephalus microplus]